MGLMIGFTLLELRRFRQFWLHRHVEGEYLPIPPPPLIINRKTRRMDKEGEGRGGTSATTRATSLLYSFSSVEQRQRQRQRQHSRSLDFYGHLILITNLLLLSTTKLQWRLFSSFSSFSSFFSFFSFSVLLILLRGKISFPFVLYDLTVDQKQGDWRKKKISFWPRDFRYIHFFISISCLN